MNVFVLCTGRSGSTTFIKACEHITNYTAKHESRIHKVGNERLNYPNWHIEADNRLTWFLGRIDEKYGDRAFYLHLKRNRDDTVASFVRRAGHGIMNAYREGIYLNVPAAVSSTKIAEDYYYTVNKNIELFLKDKSNTMIFHMEKAEEDFSTFWKAIDAQGSLEKSLWEWSRKYNASVSQLTDDRGENADKKNGREVVSQNLVGAFGSKGLKSGG